VTFERIPLHLVFEEKQTVRDSYGGIGGLVALQAHLLKPPVPSETLLVFMHPMGIMHYLPMPMGLAAAGIHCLSAVSRYPNNDSALVMEKVLVDLAAWIAHAREKLGYSRIVLAGWSGGGSLSLFYQRQAVAPFITDTPAGDPVALPSLVPADAMLLLAAHVSRAATLTEWLDPSVTDEHDPLWRDPTLDLYGNPPPESPPYSADFLARFRAAQVARNQRISQWALARLETVRTRLGPHGEEAFVVHGTMADPRWLDPSLDPNDRVPGRCYLGDPRLINDAPGGLARYATLRSWLSQWSLEHSRADGPACAAFCTVPTLVLDNSADDACTPSHADRLYAGLAAEDRTRVTIRGATHYYAFQPDKLKEAVASVAAWLAARGFDVAA
jgi:alpha-beta hydrolase superfamily lysophospholipase